MNETITAQLVGLAGQASDLPTIQGAGVYGIFLREGSSLAEITPGDGGVLYIGMTDQGLDARNHFHHAHSGFSTLRRSLGAILKPVLNLTARPRSSGTSKTNVRNYRFSDEGEHALTSWMHAHLKVGQVALDGDVRAYEAYLISALEPPLNLTGWNNPQRAWIKRLRAACVEEAEQNRPPRL